MLRAPALLPHVSAGSARTALALLRLLLLGRPCPAPVPRSPRLPALAPPALPGMPRRVLSNFLPLKPPHRSGIHRPRSALSLSSPLGSSHLLLLLTLLPSVRKDWLLVSPLLPPLLTILLDCLLFAGGRGRRGGEGRLGPGN